MKLTPGVPDVDPEAESVPTVDDEADDDLGRLRRARRVRQGGFALLCAVLVLGLAGMLGVREGTADGSGNGYDLEVAYPRTTRPGLAVPLTVTIRKAGGFDGPVTVTLTQAYLRLFDLNGMFPDPDKATADGDVVEWEFEAPSEGDVLEILVDTRTGPNVQRGRRGEVAVLDEAGDPLVTASFRTTVVP